MLIHLTATKRASEAFSAHIADRPASSAKAAIGHQIIVGNLMGDFACRAITKAKTALHTMQPSICMYKIGSLVAGQKSNGTIPKLEIANAKGICLPSIRISRKDSRFWGVNGCAPIHRWKTNQS